MNQWSVVKCSPGSATGAFIVHAVTEEVYRVDGKTVLFGEPSTLEKIAGRLNSGEVIKFEQVVPGRYREKQAMKNPEKPRKNSVVELSKWLRIWATKHKKNTGPLFKDTRFVFLGELVNMPDHCVVVGMQTRKIFPGYHTYNFTEVLEDEV